MGLELGVDDDTDEGGSGFGVRGEGCVPTNRLSTTKEPTMMKKTKKSAW